MKKNDVTDVMDTKQGFLILQVLEHYDEGEQSLAKVENEITEKLYSGRMEPAMREYVKTLREQSYVVIKPGYQDMAGGGNSEIQEVSATPEAAKKNKRATRNTSSSANDRATADEDRLSSSISALNRPSPLFSSSTKKKFATPAKANPIYASSSAIAAAPSKPACGTSSNPSPAKSIATTL